MLTETLLPLILFAATMTGTPGPNNVMLMTSGANFGYIRTLPHMGGIAAGIALMIVCVGFGLHALFQALPELRLIMTGLSVAFLLYIAWKIATSELSDDLQNTGRPMHPIHAAAFQWINPKAWFMVLSAITIYVDQGSAESIFLVAVIFASVCIPVTSVWVLAGVQIRRFLTNQMRLRTFNWCMSGLLVVSLYPLIQDHLS